MENIKARRHDLSKLRRQRPPCQFSSASKSCRAPVAAGSRLAEHDAPPRGPLPPPRRRLLRLHAPRQGANPGPQPPASPGPPSSMAPSRLRCLLIGTAAAAASSIPASGPVAFGWRRSQRLVAQPRGGRQVRRHRRDLVRARSLPPFCLRRRTPCKHVYHPSLRLEHNDTRVSVVKSTQIFVNTSKLQATLRKRTN